MIQIRLIVVISLLGSFIPLGFAKEKEQSFIEKQTGFRKIEGDDFILDLKYKSNNNFLKKDVYSQFGLDACYVHPDLYVRLMDAAKLVRSKNRKIVLFDCFRPLKIQKEMWKIVSDSRYVANPVRGSPHNRGVAVDIGIAEKDGTYLEFPTEFDSFEEKAERAYQCPKEENYKCKNRDWLHYLMNDVGLFSISTEWWHFQLPNAKNYPIKDL